MNNLKIFLIKVACYGVLYIILNIFGIYHLFLNSIFQEDSYKNTIKFINGRVQLEKEKQQQVYT